MPANPKDEDVATADDDLTRIEGIGPKRAERLKVAGIRTYADLAARSAMELATLLPELTGLSTTHLDSWRDRARELTGLAVSTPTAATPEVAHPTAAVPPSTRPGNGQHEESFLVRVLLNEDGSVRRTMVRHVGTGAQRQWPGLEADEISGFIATAVTMPRPSDEQPSAGTPGQSLSTPPATGMAPGDEGSPARPANRTVASAPLTAAGPVTASVRLAAGPTVLRAGEPFTMTMALELAEAATGTDRLTYTATIVAKPLAGGPQQTVAYSNGLVAAAMSAIPVDCAGLAPGAYRLDGVISLRRPGSERPASVAAFAEGLLVHVLPG